MTRFSHLLFAAALATNACPGQTVADVGLMMDGGILTVIYGQDCGPFTCQPFTAGPTGAGQPHNVYVFGAPQQFFALAADVDTGQGCLPPIPGVGNRLLLAQPVTLAFGFVGNVGGIGLCQQGRGHYVLQLPSGTPPGVAYRLQAVAVSSSLGIPALTVAIRSTT